VDSSFPVLRQQLPCQFLRYCSQLIEIFPKFDHNRVLSELQVILLHSLLGDSPVPFFRIKINFSVIFLTVRHPASSESTSVCYTDFIMHSAKGVGICHVLGVYLDLRGRKWRDAEEECIVRSFITCTRHQIRVLLG
jgi:hypothetical protein